MTRERRSLEPLDPEAVHWNESAGDDVGYLAPAVPDERSAPDDDRLDRNDVADIEEALDELGRTVSEVLENDYIHRDEDEFGYDWEWPLTPPRRPCPRRAGRSGR